MTNIWDNEPKPVAVVEYLSLSAFVVNHTIITDATIWQPYLLHVLKVK